MAISKDIAVKTATQLKQRQTLVSKFLEPLDIYALIPRKSDFCVGFSNTGLRCRVLGSEPQPLVCFFFCTLLKKKKKRYDTVYRTLKPPGCTYPVVARYAEPRNKAEVSACEDKKCVSLKPQM